MVTIGIVELATAAVAILAAMAELLHARRCRRLARLAFGPGPAPGDLGQVGARGLGWRPSRHSAGDWRAF